MTDQHTSVLSREVGCRLRRAMEAAGFTGKRMARVLGYSEARISRWLTGRSPVSDVDAAAFLAVCDVIGRAHASLMALVRDQHTSSVLRLVGVDQRHGYRDHIGTADSITEFAGLELPLSVQTPGYAREMAKRLVGIPTREGENVVSPHEHAAGLLTSPHPPQVTLLVHEWLLRTPVGGAAVLSEQLGRLLRLSVLPHVSLLVLPIDAGANAACRVPFGLAESAAHGPVLYRQHDNALVLWDGSDEVVEHRAVLARLTRAACDERRSRDLIARLAAEPGASSRVREPVLTDGPQWVDRLGGNGKKPLVAWT